MGGVEVRQRHEIEPGSGDRVTDHRGSKVFVVYVGQDQHLHLVWGDGSTEGWRTLDVTGANGAPRLAGDPVVSSASGAAAHSAEAPTRRWCSPSTSRTSEDRHLRTSPETECQRARAW